MTHRSTFTRTLTAIGSAALAVGLLAACSSTPATTANSSAAATGSAATEAAAQTPSQVLSSTAWETTGAVDQDGNKVELGDERAANFVGFAYFKDNGTFTMYTVDDSPKMQGDWSVTPDGKTRHIVAKDDAGKELFQRDSQITTLTGTEFTYRVPSQETEGDYVDIIHTPTTHAEPAK